MNIWALLDSLTLPSNDVHLSYTRIESTLTWTCAWPGMYIQIRVRVAVLSDGHSSHRKFGTNMGGRTADHGVAPPRINDSDGERELVIMAAESVVPQMTSAEFQRWKQQKVCVQSPIHTHKLNSLGNYRKGTRLLPARMSSIFGTGGMFFSDSLIGILFEL